MRRPPRLGSLNFGSSMTVEWRGGLMGLGRVSLSLDLAWLPRVGHHFGRWEESCFLLQVSIQRRDYRVEAWVEGNGKADPWFGLGTLGPGNHHRRPLGAAPEKPHLSTGLTLRVTVSVCAQGGPPYGRGLRPMLVSPILKVGQHGHSLVSCHGEGGVLISASDPLLRRDWR